MADELYLPRSEAAEVPTEKLQGYALDPEHPTGRHKARLFASVLGIAQEDWVFLRSDTRAR